MKHTADINALDWGNLDDRGRQVIATRFRAAGPFSEGLAAIAVPAPR